MIETQEQADQVLNDTVKMFDQLVGKNDHKNDAKIAGVAWIEGCKYIFDLNPSNENMEKTGIILRLLEKGVMTEFPDITHEEMRAAADAYIEGQVKKELASESRPVS